MTTDSYVVHTNMMCDCGPPDYCTCLRKAPNGTKKLISRRKHNIFCRLMSQNCLLSSVRLSQAARLPSGEVQVHQREAGAEGVPGQDLRAGARRRPRDGHRTEDPAGTYLGRSCGDEKHHPTHFWAF